MTIKKTRLAQMITAEQTRRGIYERVAAVECGVSQQTFGGWKGGNIPRSNKHAALANFLGISFSTMDELIEEAEITNASAKIPHLSTFDTAREYGRVVDRKEGKFKFDTARKAVPTGRYLISMETNCMEPIFRVGTRVWIDPAVITREGDEVIVHTAGGFAWIGLLDHWELGRATISRPSGWKRELDNVTAVHSIVLSERV